MESIAACPEDVLELLRGTCELFRLAEAAMRRLPDDLPAARNLFDALLENRDRLDVALTITANLIDPAWRAGWAACERAQAQSRRPALYAV